MTIASRTFENYDEYVYKQGGKARGRREHLLKHAAKNTESFERVFRKARTAPEGGAGALSRCENRRGVHRCHAGRIQGLGRDRPASGRPDRPAGRLARR
jgi:hypothetical protein